MRIAIPAANSTIDSPVDDRFGRCPYFCVYNSDNRETSFLENTYKGGSGGVGPQVAEFLANNHIQKIMAIEIGPKAMDLLNRLNIKTEIISNGLTIQKVIDTLNS
jgi:predicted Fe-Mo cluster-binding NifX family protein